MPESWLRITVTSPSDELLPLLAEGLLASGGSAVHEQDAQLTTYLREDGEAEQRVAQVQTLLSAIAGHDITVQWDVVPGEDWLSIWRAGLGPRRVGPRIIVSPTWSAPNAGPRDIVIRIDPQMAFGTGEHASTRGVLRLMQRVVGPGTRLLDIGTGSAIIAIAGARLGAAHVVAVESDAEALPNAQENVAANRVADRVSLVHALVDDAFLAAYGGGAFDAITANVLSGVLQPLLPALHRALVTDGWAILAGILVEEGDAMRDAAANSGFHVEAVDVEEQWWSALLRRL